MVPSLNGSIHLQKESQILEAEKYTVNVLKNLKTFLFLISNGKLVIRGQGWNMEYPDQTASSEVV